MPIEPESITALVEQIFALQRAVRQAGASTPADSDATLTYPHQAILGMLCRHGAMRLSECASHVGVSPSVMSRQISDLLEAGLVEKQRDPGDGRATVIQVTDTGRERLHRTRAARASRLRERLEDWTDADAISVTQALTKLTDSLGRGTSQR